MSRRFAIIPARALDDDNISNADLRILCAFGRETDKNGWCHVKQKTIATAAGMSRGYINTRIKNLVACGILEQHQQTLTGRGQGASKYRLLFDVIVPTNGENEAHIPDVAIDDIGGPMYTPEITPPVHSDITPKDTLRSSIPKGVGSSAREDVISSIEKCLGNAVNPRSAKMHTFYVPVGWLTGENACDLELDFIPTVTAICEAAKPQSISSWNYFRAAVFRARDERLTPQINPTPETTNAKSNNRPSDKIAAIGDRRRQTWSRVLSERQDDGMATEI